MLNLGFGAILVGVVVFVITVIVFAVVSLRSFGSAVKNMTDDKLDFEAKFKSHGNSMKGMASGMLILAIGGGVGLLSVAGGVIAIAYNFLAP